MTDSRKQILREDVQKRGKIRPSATKVAELSPKTAGEQSRSNATRFLGFRGLAAEGSTSAERPADVVVFLKPNP